MTIIIILSVTNEKNKAQREKVTSTGSYFSERKESGLKASQSDTGTLALTPVITFPAKGLVRTSALTDTGLYIAPFYETLHKSM